jgi:hypothetical protein
MRKARALHTLSNEKKKAKLEGCGLISQKMVK